MAIEIVCVEEVFKCAGSYQYIYMFGRGYDMIRGKRRGCSAWQKERKDVGLCDSKIRLVFLVQLFRSSITKY